MNPPDATLKLYRLPADSDAVESLLRRLRLDAGDLALLRGGRADKARAVASLLEDVALRGDAALVDSNRRFDDPDFSPAQLAVTLAELLSAHDRISKSQPDLLAALRHSIAQVRQYQAAIMPPEKPPLRRGEPAGCEAALRWLPLESAGLYVPGGSASYPSSLIMLAVPAIVAGVGRIVVCTPPSRHFSDALLATAHELGIVELYRVGGVAAVAALALGTPTIKPVDKILGPGNEYVQLAKRAVSGAVGIDGYLGPSEILVVADGDDVQANAPSIAADMLAQAEHDPGTCFLVTTSASLVTAVQAELSRQLATLPRAQAVTRSLQNFSAAIVCPTEADVLQLANRIACEHVSLRVGKNCQPRYLAAIRNAGCIFVGPHSPVAAGDYVAGPSHCLPTNTTARFASGVSVYEFLKRNSIVHYTPQGLASDTPHIATFARAEGLEAHARSAEIRGQPK